MQYDIEEFYPSISENLLKKAIDYARSFVNISSEEEQTIMHCRKSLLFSNSDIQIKKVGNKDFDVTALMAQKFVSWLVFIFYIY